MTVTDLNVRRTRTTPLPRPESTPQSDRVAELQEMIRSGRYAGYLAELKDELAKVKAAKAEVVGLYATSALAA